MDDPEGPVPARVGAGHHTTSPARTRQDGSQATAILVTGPDRYEIVPRSPAPLRFGEARVSIHAAGVCGDDEAVLRGTRPHGYARYPVVPGHEWSGTVRDVGPGVPLTWLGRKVVGESVLSCQMCQRCRLGENTLCEAGYEEVGFTRPGAMATALTLPAHSLHALHDDADLTAAALLEPAARAAAAVLTADPGNRENVAVVGDGTTGLLTVQVLRAAAPRRPITVLGARPAREAMALSCGAHTCMAPGDSRAAGFDVVIDTVGTRAALKTSLDALRNGGRLICTTATGQGQLAPGELIRRQLRVQTAFGAPAAAWARAVRLYAQGLLSLLPLITHHLPLQDYRRAVELTVSDDPAVGKVLLHPPGEESSFVPVPRRL
ncbi:zinc-dependent alcohol dehydrogenase [Streptomyces phaeoluteigriseus]